MAEKLGRVFLFGIAYAVMLAGMGVGIWLPVRLVRECWEDPSASPGDSLALLEEARRLMEDYGIPLPPQDTVDFLAKQKGAGQGECFAGQQRSRFIPQ